MINCELAKTDNGCPKNLEICCCECGEKDTCDGVCNYVDNVKNCGHSVMDEESALLTMQKNEADVIKSISNLTLAKKKIEDQEKLVRKALIAAMEKYGVKSFDTPEIKFVYVAPTTRTSIDSTKLKKELPDVAAKYSKTTPVSASVKITVKE